MSKVSGAELSKPNIFFSYKTQAPILYKRRWQWRWLVWATISPDIDRIDPFDEVLPVSEPFALALSIGSSGNTRQYLLIDHGEIDLPKYTVVKRSDALRQLDVSIAQSIWRERQRPIPFDVISLLREGRRFNSINELAACIEPRCDGNAHGILAACWATGLLDMAIPTAERARFLHEIAQANGLA